MSAHILKTSSCKDQCNLSFIFLFESREYFFTNNYPSSWHILWIYQAKQHHVRSNLPVSSVNMNLMRVSYLRSRQKLSAGPVQGCPAELGHCWQVKVMKYYDGAWGLYQRLLLWDVTHQGALLDHHKICWLLPFALAIEVILENEFHKQFRWILYHITLALLLS